MTPNTRRSKEDSLFVGHHQHSADTASRGGISVTSVLLPSASNTHDSVALWYNETVFYIDSLQAYWSRAAKRSTETKLQTSAGSLFGPGLTRIEGLDFHGQMITSIDQLSVKDDKTADSSAAIVLATDHGVTVAAHPLHKPDEEAARRSHLSSKTSYDLRQSQALLRKGELDIEQLDVMMNDIENNHEANTADTLRASRQFLEHPVETFMSGALPLVQGR